MIYRNRKALSWTGASLALAGILVLSACDNKESTPAAAPSDTASAAAVSTGDPAAAASASRAADDMHDVMEAEQRQKMDHDNMWMGPGMNHPASPAPSPQPTATNSSMPMQDM